ncbi:hypothetical protein RB195_000506 [Necator americanus]|uniref:Uncharacterized protein n=1 Tax=Necator americanus TaxID=51031 RepID=A0ABR1DA30_NECAM
MIVPQERINAVNLAQRIANFNGYIPDVPHRSLFNELSRAIRASVIRCGLEDRVRVIGVPPTNFKTQLI